LIKALKSLKSNCEISTGGFAFGEQAVNRLNPIRSPPLAKEEVLINPLLLKVIFVDVDIFIVFNSGW
jgi:hypothetical protein